MPQPLTPAVAELDVRQLSAMSTFPPPPKRYSAEIIRSDGERSLVFEDGVRGRVEDGKNILIRRLDKGVAWNLTPETKTYSQVKLTKEMVKRAISLETLCDWRADGTEVIDGRNCLRFIGHYHSADGASDAAHEIYYVDAKTHMPRRNITFDLNGKKALTVDTLNVVLGPQPREIFEIPAGYKRGYRRKAP